MNKDINYLIWYKRRRRFLALVVFFVVAIVWAGWVTNTPALEMFFNGFPPMSPLAALGALLMAVVVFQPPRIARGLFMAMAIGVGIGSLALVTLAVWPRAAMPLVLKFFIDGPAVAQNNFAPFTPICFALLAIVAICQQVSRARQFRQTVVIGIIFLVYFILIGHISQAEYVHAFTFFAYVSIPAEICIALLALGLLYHEGSSGIMGLLTSTTEGGMISRELFILVLLAPALTTYVVLIGVQTGFYERSLATPLNVVVNVVFFELFIWHLGQRLRLTEEVKLRTEAELVQRKNELETFKQATDASTEGVLMTNGRGDIIYVNEAWEAQTGWKFSEVEGKNPRLLKSGKTDPLVFTKMWKALTTGKTFWTDAIVNRRKNGRDYDAEVHIFPIRHSTEEVFYVELQRDVSERKAMDQAKTEFVSIASHQLATPLSSMRWTLELLADTKPIRKEQRHYLQTVTDENLRMIELVNALLNTSRIDVGSFMIVPQTIDLAAELRSVLAELRLDIEEKHLHLQVKIGTIPKSFSADPALLRMVMQNLLTNAIRYTPERKRITVSVSLVQRRVTLTVADTGYGIPPNEQGKIFQKMFRASNAVLAVPNGTGLGLYIVKGVVDRSGGVVGFTSTMGVGTTFTVSWPKTGWRARTGSRQLSYPPQSGYTRET